MTRKILITGASGFVGSHLAERALKLGFEVYAGVRATSSRKSLAGEGLHFFPFDSSKPAELKEELTRFGRESGGFDIVIHCAAVTRPRSIEEFFNANAVFTEVFARMVKETQSNLDQFIFISSLAAQGPGKGNYEAISEISPEHPITPYGKSKLEAEKRLRSIQGLPLLIFRPAAVYGPRDEKFILRVLKMLDMGWSIKMGTKTQKQSYIYISDLADAIFTSIRKGITKEMFLLADGGGYNQDKLYEVIKKHINKKGFPVRIPRWISVTVGFVSLQYAKLMGKPLHLSHHKMRELTAENWFVDISKARQQLDFTPKYDLEKGLIETLDIMQMEKASPKEEVA